MLVSYELFKEGPSVYIPVLLLSIVVTMLAYGAFPIVFSRICKSSITKKKYHLICYCVNFLVVILFIVINGKSNGAPYILWTGVFSSLGWKKVEVRKMCGKSIKENVHEVIEKSANVSEHIEKNDVIENSLSSKEEPQKIYGSYNVFGSDVAYIKNDEVKLEGCDKTEIIQKPIVENRIQTRIVLQKEKPVWRIAAICLALVLVSSLVVHIYIFSNWQPKDEVQADGGKLYSSQDEQIVYSNLVYDNQLLKEQISEMEDELAYYKNEIDFIDAYVVFVEDDGTSYYHKYECNSFVGNSFWVYNVELAIDSGYYPCPFCCR